MDAVYDDYLVSQNLVLNGALIQSSVVYVSLKLKQSCQILSIAWCYLMLIVLLYAGHACYCSADA